MPDLPPHLAALLTGHATYRVERRAERTTLHVTFNPGDTVRALLESGLDDATFDDAAAVLAHRLGTREAARLGLRGAVVEISGRYGDGQAPTSGPG